jgi:hypothetical protein
MTGVRLLLVVGVVLSAGGCGGTSPTSPTPGTPTTYTGSVTAFGITSHAHTADRAGTATIALTWTGSVDLDLYVTSTTCTGYPPDACVLLARSAGTSGQREDLSLTVTAGQALKVWVDNFSTQGTAAYTITITQQ